MQTRSTSSRARSGRRPWAFVVRDPTPDDAGAAINWSSWYLTDEDDMGEGVEQNEIIRRILSTLAELADERGWADIFWASDSFFAWVRSEPLVRVSPDVYLMDGPPPEPRPRMWQTWLPGHRPPRWAVEIVSEDWRKDYEDAPLKYAQLGARELVIFDPDAARSPERRSSRAPLTLYRRSADGAFVRVYSGQGPVWSEEIGAALVAKPMGAVVHLVIARDAAGQDLVPTSEEAKRAANARAEAAEARLDVEAKARRDAEARMAALEAEISRLRSAR
jgi:Uma2 family endonuclease